MTKIIFVCANCLEPLSNDEAETGSYCDKCYAEFKAASSCVEETKKVEP